MYCIHSNTGTVCNLVVRCAFTEERMWTIMWSILFNLSLGGGDCFLKRTWLAQRSLHGASANWSAVNISHFFVLAIIWDINIATRDWAVIQFDSTAGRHLLVASNLWVGKQTMPLQLIQNRSRGIIWQACHQKLFSYPIWLCSKFVITFLWEDEIFLFLSISCHSSSISSRGIIWQRCHPKSVNYLIWLSSLFVVVWGEMSSFLRLIAFLIANSCNRINWQHYQQKLVNYPNWLSLTFVVWVSECE